MIIRAPEPLKIPTEHRTKEIFFLAGSIEMGAAINWQTKVEEVLDPVAILLNPRRLDWDSSWKQGIDEPKFYEQVTWELDAMNRAKHILMYFDAATKSPITLLELGLHASDGKLTVCCPEGFWRKGNVDVVCEQYNIYQVSSLESLIGYAMSLVRRSKQ